MLPKETFVGLEGNCERPVPSRFKPKFSCDTRNSLWTYLLLLFRLVVLPFQSTNAHSLFLRVTLPKVELMSTPSSRHGILPMYSSNSWPPFKGHHHHPPQHHFPGTGLYPISLRPPSESTQWVESGLPWAGPEAGTFKERQRAKGGKREERETRGARRRPMTKPRGGRRPPFCTGRQDLHPRPPPSEGEGRRRLRREK